MSGTTVFPSLRTPEGIARAIRRATWVGAYITLQQLRGFQKLESTPEIVAQGVAVLFFGVATALLGWWRSRAAAVTLAVAYPLGYAVSLFGAIADSEGKLTLRDLPIILAFSGIVMLLFEFFLVRAVAATIEARRMPPEMPVDQVGPLHSVPAGLWRSHPLRALSAWTNRNVP